MNILHARKIECNHIWVHTLLDVHRCAAGSDISLMKKYFDMHLNDDILMPVASSKTPHS